MGARNITTVPISKIKGSRRKNLVPGKAKKSAVPRARGPAIGIDEICVSDLRFLKKAYQLKKII